MTQVAKGVLDGRAGLLANTFASANQYAEVVGSDAPPEKVRFEAFLRAEMAAQHLTIAELARRTGVRYTVASRWLDQVIERRMVPNPAKCRAIANALGLDELLVLSKAGHLGEARVKPYEASPLWEAYQAFQRAQERMFVALQDWQRPIALELLGSDLERQRTLLDRMHDIYESSQQNVAPRDGH